MPTVAQYAALQFRKAADAKKAAAKQAAAQPAAASSGLGTLLGPTAPTAATDTAATATPAPAAAVAPAAQSQASTYASTYTPYTLPGGAEAIQSLRDLQTKSTTGLGTLLGEDPSAAQARYENAFYTGQEESINTAAERARQALIEGTFARGVGPSSITVELAGRNQQEQSDALARARREAITAAGSESRADIAARAAALSAGLSGSTTGLQGEANVALTNLAREQQASQFGQNLAFQGSENAANRASQEGMFGKNLDLQYSQLAQQESQFGRNLSFQGSENAANRELTATQAELNRQAAAASQASAQDFTSAQNALNRLAATTSQTSAQDFTAAQNEATRALTQLMASNALAQTAADNAANRNLTEQLATQGQTFTGEQNALNRQQSMDALILQLQNSQEIAGGQQVASAAAAAGGGLGALLGPILNRITDRWTV